MKLWEEIKQQPPHIREMFMWTFVVITFSIVGFVWMRSTTKQFLALVNPEYAEQSRVLAEEQDKTESPFATIFVAFKNLRADIGQLFDFSKRGNDFEVIKNQRTESADSVEAQELPLSGDR